MLKLIFGRLLQGLIVLLIVSALTFALLAAAGGDALTALQSDPLVSEQTIKELRRTYGLDQPLHVRYLRWLTDLIQGRMGQSFFYKAPVGTIVRSRLGNTLYLAITALFFAWAIALMLGAMAARRARGSWIDRLCSVVILLAASTPRIVLALVALAVAVRTSLFNVGAASMPSEESAASSLARLLVPALVLSVPLIALFLAQVREGLRTALSEEFVQVARAKGLAERVVIFRHALRAALNPLITIFGYSLGGVVSGSVIVETVLGWPGLGQLSVIAVRNRDAPLLMGVMLVTATAVLVGNLVADILLRLNDPRLGEEERESAGTSNAEQRAHVPAGS
ncbi:MAG TPA: ABC transporter permease [Pyrinomonadaceae bacterium]|nr:ABC transporter permease [Pyrinomonadaceae bacterium]